MPVGSTEDHGDHGPLWTDVYIPLEVAKRAAPELEALVGPPIPFGIAHDHRGAHGLVHVRMDTFLDLVRDVCLSLTDVGFTRIVLLNGHYCNSHALEFAVARFHDDLPAGARVYPFPYWAGMAPEEAEQYLSGSAGIHANVGETSIVLAIDEDLCDMERVRDFTPTLPELRTNALALLDPLFLATPGLVLVAARGRRRRVGEPERVDSGEGRGVPRVGHPRRRQPRARHGRRARPAGTPLPPHAEASRCLTLNSASAASSTRSTAPATLSCSSTGSAPTTRRGRSRPSICRSRSASSSSTTRGSVRRRGPAARIPPRSSPTSPCRCSVIWESTARTSSGLRWAA